MAWINDLLGKGKCLIGIHTSEWVYVEDGSCRQTLDCKRCGHKTRVKHPSYTDNGYMEEGECWKHKTCNRCNQGFKWHEHDYGPEEYANSFECSVFTKTCKRCGYEYIKTKPYKIHDWGNWQANPHIRNQMFRVCRRCGEKDFNTIQ